MPRTNDVAAHLLRAALLTFAASLIFWAFFQISKSPNFAAANPFADDPVDAIGSIAVQVALAVSILTLARAAQVSRAPTAPTYKSRLIVRGNSVTLFAIAITLMADLSAELQHPTWNESIWGMLLIIGLGTVALITCAAIMITWAAVRHGKAESFTERQAINEAGSLGEGLTDLWTLVRLIFAWFSQRLPWLRRPLQWVDALGNRLFEWMMNWPWIGPRAHPWRFCASVGLALGIDFGRSPWLGGRSGVQSAAVRFSRDNLYRRRSSCCTDWFSAVGWISWITPAAESTALMIEIQGEAS